MLRPSPSCLRFTRSRERLQKQGWVLEPRPFLADVIGPGEALQAYNLELGTGVLNPVRLRLTSSDVCGLNRAKPAM